MLAGTLIVCLAFAGCISAEAEAEAQFFAFSGARVNQGCPISQPLPRSHCKGRLSVCWSPGVRDTDCPGHGLCCFDGCVNSCGPQQIIPVAPPPRQSIESNLIPFLPPLSPIHVLVKRTTRQPSNPCVPTPCGPGTTCRTSGGGNAICNCLPGLIAKPDTITGCGPECTVDPECRNGEVCLNQRCVEEPDPCNPSPCGPGAICSASKRGNSFSNPTCRCEPGLIPKPDTITGCGPECVIDPDCQTGYVCDNQRCVEKGDPCDPSPCGPGARCMKHNENAICRCEPGLIPKPDTITGCGPECVVDPDCPNDFICESQRCILKPDHCDPSPCGPGAYCEVTKNGNPICRCDPGLIPKPDTITGCGPECVVDPDCQGQDYICENQKCILRPDPCDPSPCGPGTMCMVNRARNPICRCLDRLIPKPDTITGCGPECTSDPDCSSGYICTNQQCVEAPDPCDPNPCGPNAICTPQGISGSTCKCPSGFFGDARVKCTQGECQRDEDCTDQEACESYYCINPCKSDTCERDFFCKVKRHVPVCGRKYVAEPQEPRETFVIGESYKPQQETISSRGGSTIGGAYNKPKSNSPRAGVFVIGSRHSGSSSGGSSRSKSSGSPRSGSSRSGSSQGYAPRSSSGSSEASVIGSTYRRRKRSFYMNFV